MTNGDIDFEKSLQQAEDLANKYELQLPHVSDSIYKLIKLIRVYDNNIQKMLKLLIKQRKTEKDLTAMCKYMSKFLTRSELRRVERHMKKREKRKKK